MINVPKNMIKAVIDGEEHPMLLKSYIMSNYNINHIIDSLVELMLANEPKAQITVSESEYNAIISLFKVKGQRVMDDGTIATETRGRKRKVE